MQAFDFLVIGSGIGGLGFALKAASSGTVGIICKGSASETNTNLAQGGLAAVTSLSDNFSIHVEDTLAAGGGLCDAEMVELLAKEAPRCIEELTALGVNFTRTESGNLDLGREGGHSRNRIVHTHDYTGFSIQQALIQAVKKHPKITLLEHHFAIDLLIDENPEGRKKCCGIKVMLPGNAGVQNFTAKAVMLATGGGGQVFQHTTNPEIATGDGLAMAFRAGAILKDLQYIQFHPTALYDPGRPTFLISEAVRGFGAELVNENGIPFMQQYHRLGSLAPRDVVSRAIRKEMEKAGTACVYLDLRHLPACEIKNYFPKIYARCLESNLNIATDLIPVVPAAHYTCGGIKSNRHGQTSIQQLYACGEVACTGIHGANRLASNSLPEAWIFASNAAVHATDYLETESVTVSAAKLIKPENPRNYLPAVIIVYKKDLVQSLMWQYTGIVRTTAGLLFCRQQLFQLQEEIMQLKNQYVFSRKMQELENLALVAILITEAALNSPESHGCHFLEEAVPEKVPVLV